MPSSRTTTHCWIGSIVLLSTAIRCLAQPSVGAPTGYLASTNWQWLSGGPSLRPTFADATGDGLSDLIRPWGAGCCIYLSPGQADLTLGPSSFLQMPTGFVVREIRCRDLDTDGIADLQVTAYLDSATNPVSNYFLKGTGGGSFAPRLPFPASPGVVQGQPTFTHCADLDGDTRPEIISSRLSFVSTLASGPYVLDVFSINNVGMPLLVSSVSVPAPTGEMRPFEITQSGDFNGDGREDVCGVGARIFAQGPVPTIEAFDVVAIPGLAGAPYLGTPLRLTVPPSQARASGGVESISIAVGDVDQDGFDDLIAYNYTSPTLQGFAIARGDPQALITPFSPLALSPTTQLGTGELMVTDLSGDDIPDLAVVVALRSAQGVLTNQWLEVFVNDGAGNFSLPLATSFSFPNQTAELARFATDGAFDNDSDGDRDLFVHLDLFGQGAILRNDVLQGPGCVGMGGASYPTLSAGRPFLGNSTFSVGLDQAQPGSLAALGLSLGYSANASPCGGPLIDFARNLLVLPADPFGLVVTDAQGQGNLSLPVPLNLQLEGVRLYAQWGVLDPTATLGVALSPLRTLILR